MATPRDARSCTILADDAPISTPMTLVSPEWWFPLGSFDIVVNEMFKQRATGLNDRGHYALNLAAALRPEAVWSLTVSEPGCLNVAAGDPVVDATIADGGHRLRVLGRLQRSVGFEHLGLSELRLHRHQSAAWQP